MKLHANAALSFRQRERMVRRVVDQGWSVRDAARAAEVSARTAGKWVARYRGAIYRDSKERTAALDGWLWTYNHRRPHQAIGREPPVSRLNNLLGSYS
jgi:transposase